MILDLVSETGGPCAFSNKLSVENTAVPFAHSLGPDWFFATKIYKKTEVFLLQRQDVICTYFWGPNIARRMNFPLSSYVQKPRILGLTLYTFT